MGTSLPGRIVRFGRFDLDLKARELRRDGLKVRLQDQPFHVLALLLEQPGEVVTREELRERLWSGDTFVDFERGLNNAVRRLREALGDSAEVPRFVDTIPRVGYRFVGPVEGGAGSAAGPAAPSIPARPAADSAQPLLRAPRRLWTVLALGALAAAAAVSLTLTRPRKQEPPGLRYITFSGQDWGPAASPDGGAVAFTSERDGRRRIWLAHPAKGDEAPLTSGPVDSGARFSPDGTFLLFTRLEAGVESLYRVATSGGEPQHLLARAANGDWSPDGRRLAYTWYAHGQRPAYVLGVADANGGRPRELALVEASWMSPPRWSPDGRWIAAAHARGPTGDWAALIFDAASGAQRRLPPTPRLGSMSVPVWSSDGRDLLYVQTAAPGSRSGRLVQQRFTGGDTATLLRLFAPGPGLDAAGRGRMVGDTAVFRQNLREYTPGGGAFESPRWLTRGFSEDSEPAYSQDGGELIFTSNRGGSRNLWALSIGSGTLRRLTDHPADDRDPRVMRGGRILWTSNQTGAFEVWIAEADGSSPRQVTHGGTNAQGPVATPEGAWIFYTTPDPDRRGLWKIRPDGSEPTPLVPGDVKVADVSPDGQLMLLLEERPPQALLRVARLDDMKLVPFLAPFEVALHRSTAPRDGPDESEYVPGCARWMPNGRAVAFVDEDDYGRRGVWIRDFAPAGGGSPSRRPLVGFAPDTQTEGFTISPDGRRVALALKEVSRHLVIIDGIRGVGR
jgi:Tol biopolymer transport system component/DNA-binding winged helix-turn-helix (wHTH) protein